MKKSHFLLFTFLIAISGFSQTTYTDIAPVLYKNCTSCHRPGGGAPFSMLSYNDASPWSTSMMLALQHGDMPPWGADTSYMHFINERPISQADKDAILQWVFDGALEGDPTQLPPPPVYPQHLLNGTPDTVIKMTTFYSNAGATDAYNIMVTPLALGQSRYVRAIELVPSDPKLIHHSLITADVLGAIPIDTSGSAFLAAQGNIAIGTWAPGSLPIVYPNSSQLKMGIQLPANGEIIMQIHTPAGTLGQAIEVELRLYFYPINEPGIRPVFDFVPLQYWGSDFWIGPEQIKSFSASNQTLPYNISIFSAFPHSHQICTEILNYAYHPLTLDTIPLIKIDKWDFEHQEYYYYKNMVKLPASYILHSDHTYENTSQNHHNPQNPPQLITVGWYSDDEMLFDGFQYIDYQPGDENFNIDSILKNDPLLNTIGITETGFAIASSVHPNPMEERSVIEFSSQSGNWKSFTLEVYNLSGQKVNMNPKLKEGSFEISKGKLSSGVYFYQISRNHKRVSAGKIIVQ
jgi:hypothetical protein